jgi:hypothetical protein
MVAIASAAPGPLLWEPVADDVLEGPREWTNEVELGDVDGDGDLDVVLANGGGYSSAGTPEPSRLLLNDGAGTFTDTSLPGAVGLHRTAKVRDLDGDGVADLFFPGAWMTPSVLLLGDGIGGWTDASDRLPPDLLAVGDAEAGDVDDDGDLDLVLADSGEGNALFGPGEVTRLWRNEGGATFTDVTAEVMPQVRVGWSWDLELADVDGDYDLDVLISCKTCDGSFLFANDGAGRFVDASAALPQRTNNYDFEALDLTGDGLPDLVTINDGPNLGERILVNTGARFDDQTTARLPASEDLGKDDNVLVLLDFDQDGDVDALIGSLSDPDRLLVNDGTGHFTVETEALAGPGSRGTLGLAAGDLDDDGRLDVVMGQGEIAWDNRWYRGVDVAVDAQPPFVGLRSLVDPLPSPLVVHATVHDRKAPVLPDDARVELRWTSDAPGVSSGGPTPGEVSGSAPMTHMGHVLWRAALDGLPAEGTLQVCATDRAGNEACSAPVALGTAGDTGGTGSTTAPDTATPETPGPGGDDPGNPPERGCRCSGSAGGEPVGLLGLGLLGLLGRRRAAVRS